MTTGVGRLAGLGQETGGGGDTSARHRLKDELDELLGDIESFSAGLLPRRKLRRYQVEPAQALCDMLLGETKSRSIVWAYSRQSGKDETLAQCLCWFLVRFSIDGGAVVSVAPTLEPQAKIMYDRLVARMDECRLSRGRYRKGDYEISLGSAVVSFVSGAPGANARGKTADRLLVGNESQDLLIDRWDSVYSPMTASTNAPSLFLGTVWDDQGLLAREMTHAEASEGVDGIKRLFLRPWRVVGAEVPAYRAHVEERIAKLGADHPYIKTEYELIPLVGGGGLFPAARLAQLAGDHARIERAEAGKVYAMLVDVAGEEETEDGADAYAADAKRDSTTVTILEVNTAAGPVPDYRVVCRYAWTGRKHTLLAPQLVDLGVNVWKVKAFVIDATGIGAGLASFVGAAFNNRRSGVGRGVEFVPHLWSSKTKSEAGFHLVGMIDSGRMKDYATEDAYRGPFLAEAAATKYELLKGSQLMRWGVPAPGHDDHVMSLALAYRLDELDWRDRTARGS